jgi:hypothetical protein
MRNPLRLLGKLLTIRDGSQWRVARDLRLLPDVSKDPTQDQKSESVLKSRNVVTLLREHDDNREPVNRYVDDHVTVDYLKVMEPDKWPKDLIRYNFQSFISWSLTQR